MKTRLLVLLAAATLAASGRAADSTATTNAPAASPTFANVKYGEHKRNVFDIWLAPGGKPAPLLFYIHGGGWRGGDKSDIPPALIQFMLEHGVSVATIRYRYTQIAILPAPVHDAARALQYIRSRAKEWHLQKERVAAIGGSAGACTALWLAYHDDLAKPGSSDPVERESTRLCAAIGLEGQTSIDPEVVVPWVGDQIMNHGMFWAAVGATNRNEAKLRYAEFQPLFREFSPINHVSPGDPPVLLVYQHPTPLPATNPGIAIHHAMLGQKLKESADRAGLDCTLLYWDKYDENAEVVQQFLLKHLGNGSNP